MALFPNSLGPHATLDDAVYYLEKEFDGQIASILPAAPSANGTYLLQCVKSNSGATYSWVSATTFVQAES